MALRDAAYEIAPIHVHSVEWSDCSVPVQKRDFWCRCDHYKRDTVRSSERAHAGQSKHSPLTRFSKCMPFDKFPERWLVWLFFRSTELMGI